MRLAIRNVRIRGLLAAATLAGVLGALSGCGTPMPADGAHAEPVTEFDESPARKRARIRLELAVGYFDEGRTEIALDEVKQVLAIDPNYAAAYNLRGLIYMRLNERRLAEESFRRGVALDPRDGDMQHNSGWLLCQQGRYEESFRAFQQALTGVAYAGRAKSYMALGLCQARAGRNEEAERNLARAYEVDPGNPVTGYNLARLLYQRGELVRAQFYIRRLNNSEAANAESLWLGIRVEQRMGDRVAMNQLADQLRKRFPQSRELASYDKGVFDE